MNAPPRIIYLNAADLPAFDEPFNEYREPYIPKSDYDALQAKLTEANLLSVTNIMLTVVPGEDGMGVEVYAKTVSDVENAFTALCTKMEDIEAKLTESQRLNTVALEAIRLAVRQNSCEMVMTGDEIRKCESAIKELERP